jgi:VanZ family protein
MPRSLKWASAILCYAVIAYYSVVSFPLSLDVHHYDKYEHFLAYALLGSLVAWAIPSRRLSRLAVLGFIIVGLAGLSTEIWQMYVPGREADVLDWVANIMGGMTGVVFERLLSACILRRRMGKTSE